MTAPARRDAPGVGRGRTPRDRRNENLDMVIGGLGFFTAAAFVATVIAEVRGEPGLREALVLLGFLVVLGLAIRARRSR